MTEKTEIMQLGAKVLRQQALAVDDFASEEFQRLIDSLHAAMLESNGVGIAAPQLGVSRRIVIVASRPTARYPHAPDMAPLIMVNPRYEVLDATLVKDWEGCLSVPGIRALVSRCRAVEVEYQDIRGKASKILLKDFPARVFQHEYDHLQGMVYLDRVESNRDIISETEFFKQIAA
ncbi:MAG: peptide deformylase [Methylomonas sp.]|nr:peptide deformylase [Methylomonas sp.]